LFASNAIRVLSGDHVGPPPLSNLPLVIELVRSLKLRAPSLA